MYHDYISLDYYFPLGKMVQISIPVAGSLLLFRAHFQLLWYHHKTINYRDWNKMSMHWSQEKYFILGNPRLKEI